MRVIGIGNRWRSDDAAGLEVARRVGGEEVADAAALVDALARAGDGAVVVDAARSGASPGTVHRFAAEDVPVGVFSAASTHALGLEDALELARALGTLPAGVTVIGIEGASFEPGGVLSPEVERAVERVVEEVTCTSRP